MVSALYPLGAALSFFQVIMDFLRMPTMSAARLARLPLTMLSNLDKLLSTTIAIGVGVSLAIFAIRAVRRESLD